MFRTALDTRQRAVVVTLHESVWLAYDAQTCGMYKAWQGTLNQAPGKQPGTEGRLFYEQKKPETPWRIIRNGKEEVPQVVFKGYLMRDTTVILKYQLVLADQTRILVEEAPECFPRKKNNNRTEVKRVFTTVGVPEGVQVALHLEYRSLLRGTDIGADAKWRNESRSKRIFDWGTLTDFSGDLVLNPNALTTLNTSFTVDPELEASTQSGN
ncbi:MAG: hypothetical protein EAZ89_03710 [Bacteroidetes bacterium]|nr:MAG: hypothetical protein EAZ89_03710 [Bacteroidota bacterium]